ncbi:MAG: hypothetical protein ACREIB_04260, partial [Pseudomonadota bacterium]
MTSATFSRQVIQRASWPVMLGLGLTALTVLVAQIALTRVMSATTGYHFAFLILSVVMLGMAASAIVAFQGMRRRKNPLAAAASVGAAYRSSIFNSCAVAVLVISPPRDFGTVIEHVQLLLAVILFSLGFFHSGFVVVVVLAQYARDVARLYWLDLAGASLGCLSAIPLLNRFSALNVMMLCAAGMAIAGTSLAFAHGGSRARRGGLLLSLAALSVWGASALQPGLLRLSFAKGQDQAQLRWEQWNALARVTVTPEIAGVREAVEMLQSRENRVYTPEQVEQFRRSWQAGWGISPEFKGESLPSLWLELDADAGTPILGGGIAALAEKGRLDFLSWDVTAAAYVWRDMLGAPAENAFIVGGGGGRDVLTALAFDVAEVDVVELNPAVVEAVEQAFGDFSGRLYSHPRVRLSIGEARNELARRTTRYDLIQMSMIDTWAASMAGSLVMTENGLYTQEAFDLYLARLKRDGVLSVSRWYDPDRHG